MTMSDNGQVKDGNEPQAIDYIVHCWMGCTWKYSLHSLMWINDQRRCVQNESCDNNGPRKTVKAHNVCVSSHFKTLVEQFHFNMDGIYERQPPHHNNNLNMGG